MENIWIYLALAYGILKGIRECMKKIALKKTGLMETLFFYMLIGFVCTLPYAKEALALEPVNIFFVFIKSMFVSIGFILSFVAIKRMPISLYSVVCLAQMVFTTIFSVVFLREPFGIHNFIGLTLVIAGLFMVNMKKDEESCVKFRYSALFAVLGYCMCNSISATMDKVLMSDMSSAQLQFWFMFFSVIIYGLIIVVRKEKISLKTLKDNYWVTIMGIILVVGDRLLFDANGHPHSKVIIITLLQQTAVIVSVIIGRIAFKEENILYKLACACVVIVGIFVSTAW